MWTQDQITNDLRELGLQEGMSVLVHASLRAVGKIDGGAETIIRAFREVLEDSGTLLVPTFTFGHSDPAGWRVPPETPEALERARAEIGVFDSATTPTHTGWIGIFPEIVRQQPDAWRSDHPVVSFAAIGANAEFLTRGAPFHYPLGSDSPLARLHQLDGSVMLIGTDHTKNSSLHLAEVWADVPYVHRTLTLRIAPDEWKAMRGSPECSEGFGKLEPILRQARLIRSGYLGNAQCQRLRLREMVSMAATVLKGDAAALLCDNPACPWCVPARRMAAEQRS